MTAPIARIVLRYLAAMLVAKGMFASDIGTGLANDPEAIAILEMVLGGVIAGATELWYWAALKFGWRK